jgi:hypothetical protein
VVWFSPSINQANQLKLYPEPKLLKMIVVKQKKREKLDFVVFCVQSDANSQDCHA